MHISFWDTHFAKEVLPHCMRQVIQTHSSKQLADGLPLRLQPTSTLRFRCSSKLDNRWGRWIHNNHTCQQMILFGMWPVCSNHYTASVSFVTTCIDVLLMCHHLSNKTVHINKQDTNKIHFPQTWTSFGQPAISFAPTPNNELRTIYNFIRCCRHNTSKI